MKVNSEQEMIDFGIDIAQKINRGEIPSIIELVGDVGAGKTTFVCGLAKGLGIKEPVTSPSFTISKSYSGQDKILVHYDFYRLTDPGLMSEDLSESLENPNNVVVIEWSDTVKNLLPKNRNIIYINYNDDDSREIEIKDTKML